MRKEGTGMAKITFSSFGTLSDGRAVTAARLENGRGCTATVLDFGATIQALTVPGRDGAPVDVVLGYDTAQEYEKSNGHLGATIGRVGNRLGGAVFSLNGKTYQLEKNNGENHLHGGSRGFDKKFWEMKDVDGALVCGLVSPDGDANYPGTLTVTVTFLLDEENALHLIYDADTDQDTLVNLTNHSYFNLNGQGDILGHSLQVCAGRFCENDAGGLPTGRLLPVEGTPFDFRSAKRIGDVIDADHPQVRLFGGFDHNFVLGMRGAAVCSEESGIEMKMETDLPGVQVYTANGLGERAGKAGTRMDRHGAVCLETQLFPNAMNCWGFPSPVLRAGQHMHTETVYRFSVR